MLNHENGTKMVITNSAKSTNCIFVQIYNCKICSRWLPWKCVARYAVLLRVFATREKATRVDNCNKNTNDNNDKNNDNNRRK